MPVISLTNSARHNIARWVVVGLCGLGVSAAVIILIAWKNQPVVKLPTVKAAIQTAHDEAFSGNYGAAETTLKQQLPSASSSADRLRLYLAIGAAYENQQQFSQAFAYYQQAVAIETSFGTLVAAARTAEQAGNKTAALKYYKQCADLIAQNKITTRDSDARTISDNVTRLEAGK